jgi:hypothetical protein
MLTTPIIRPSATPGQICASAPALVATTRTTAPAGGQRRSEASAFEASRLSRALFTCIPEPFPESASAGAEDLLVGGIELVNVSTREYRQCCIPPTFISLVLRPRAI